MLHGAAARFPQGSVACLAGLRDEAYADRLCEVLHFEPGRGRWAVRLQEPSFSGKELLVREECLQLVFCILPEHALPRAVASRCQAVEHLTACGRGLVTLDPCQQGALLFQEPPFLLAAAGVRAAWQARWHAYLRLTVEAEKDEAARQALEAFDRLSADCAWPREELPAWDAAAEVAEASGYRADAEDERAFQEVVGKIEEVLLKVKTNQFDFENGSKTAACAIFRQSSLMNHSCRPSVSAACCWEPLEPGTMKLGDGLLEVRALRPLAPGDAVCFNYGPLELLEWPVAQRRKHLFKELGFWCVCQRCLQESGEEAGQASAAAADAPRVSLSTMD